MERTYTDEQLASIDKPNFIYEGREYTTYQATQKQREIERTIRKWKRRLAASVTEEDETTAKMRLRRLNEKYNEFSKAAGLRKQPERMNIRYVDDASKEKAATLKLQREAEAPIRKAIKSGEYPLNINPDKQARHMMETAAPGRSVITISSERLQEIIIEKAGTGKIVFARGTFNWTKREIIAAGEEIGYTINQKGDKIIANSLKIHYSNTGVHAVPYSQRWKK